MIRLRSAGALALAVMVLVAPMRSSALHIPLPTKCFCFSGLGGHLMQRNGRDCNDVCNYVDKKKKVSLTDVSASRRLRPHRPRNRLHHDGDGGHRFAGHRSRARGGAQATAGVGVAQAEGDHDGRIVGVGAAVTSERPRVVFRGNGSLPEFSSLISSTIHSVIGGRPRAWCGWYARQLVGSDPGPAYNLARNWAHWGHAASPGPGVIVVWPHHVGMITGQAPNGLWIVHSGNDGGGQVRTRPRSVSGAIAFRAG